MLKKICLFAFALFINVFAAFAADEPYVNMLRGAQLTAGSFFTVTDEKIRNAGTNNFTLSSVDNILSFEIDFYANKFFYNTSFTCTANLTIEAYDRFDTTQKIPGWPKTIKLEIKYNKNEGERYKGMGLYKFKGAHKFKVTVDSISSAELGSPLPEIFLLKGTTIVHDRKYDLQPPLSTARTTYTKEPGKLNLQWNPGDYPGAEMFDLEYTFIDKHSLISERLRTAFSPSTNVSGPFQVPADTLNKWFKNNSTRVTLTSPSYLLNLSYDSGYVLFRIRGVQMSMPPDEIRLTTVWNYQAIDGNTQVQTTAAIFTDGHEQNLNWQYAATFAEEGKRKEVMSYFDGSLKGRQAVTINNSDNRSVVQESIYDEIGRPVVSLLPAPADDSTLHYFRAFNRNQAGNPFSFTDIVYAKCGVTVSPLSTASGTSQYYSPQNPFTGFLHQAYIPDALGYPIAVTEHTPDNTGRIKRQGGVGAAFQLNKGHETSYFYGKPAQPELDRLFGSEAGEASHYLKNMVVDPNGQISVSYVNASGKTIATALAGKSPPNLHPLPSNSESTIVKMTNELITGKSFVPNAASYSLTASATFLAPVTGDYIFTYNVNPQRLDIAHGENGEKTICNTCYYDVLITVRDGCDDTIQTRQVPAGFVFDSTCAVPAPISGTFTAGISKIGEYNVSYELKVSKAALDFYDAEHIKKNTNLKKVNSFLLDQLKETDFTGCYSNCETCKEDLGDKEEFNNYFKTLYDKSAVEFGEADSLWVNNLYDSLYANCAALQASADCGSGPCEDRLVLLKADVTPAGQYALLDSTWQHFTNVDGENDSTSVFAFHNDGTNVLYNYTSIDFTDGSGKIDSVANSVGDLVPVKQLTQDEFIKNWKDSWADSLVTRHPEYCYYRWCLANPGSYAFDDMIQDFDDADSAMRAGYFDSTRVRYDALLQYDPFFNGGLGSSLKDRMRDSLRLFSRTLLRYGVPDKTILQFIDVALYCNNQYSGWQGCLPPDNECRSDYQEWLLYRNLYLNLKRKFYEEARRTSNDPVFANCSNCSIGKDNFSLANAPIAINPATPFSDSTTCNYSCPGGIYSPADRNGISFFVQYGTPTVSPTNTPSGYGNCQFYNVFDLQKGGGISCRFLNVWVCMYDSSCNVTAPPSSCGQSFSGSSPAISGFYTYPDQTINVHTVAQGGSISLYYDAIELPNNFTIYDGTTGAMIATTGWQGYATYEGQWGNSLNTQPSGVLTFTRGASSTYILRVTTQTQQYENDAWNASIACDSSAGAAPCPVPASYPSQCPDNAQASLYKDKIRRYPDYVNTDSFIGQVLASNPAGQSQANAAAIIDECKSSCEAQADNWIAALSNCNADSAQLTQLRAAFVEICSAGCAYSKGNHGSSSVPAGSGTAYNSFEEAIIGILGADHLNDACTAELIGTPYPYNRQPFDANRTVFTTDYDICNKLQQYRSQYSASGFAGSLHAYLQELLKSDYTLDSLDLDNLVKSCTTCNGILKEPVVLPIAFEPGSRPCLDCGSVQQLLSSFTAKYNITPANPRYETLLTNYFNHSLGFSLTYQDYRDFMDSCDAHGGNYSGRLCDQPVSPAESSAVTEGNSCTGELFNTALENAYIEYNQYIDSVHLAFREAYTTKCLNVQAGLSMTADLYEYHYTLYYYDQSGNLVKTIPPEGVKLLTQQQIDTVQQYRKLNTDGCYQYSNYLKLNESASAGGRIQGNKAFYPLMGSKAYTIEMWVKPSSYADQGLFSHAMHATTSPTVYSGVSLSLVNKKLNVYLYDMINSASSPDVPEIKLQSADVTGKLKLNEWNHIAVTVQGSGYGSVRLFLNGQDPASRYLKDTPCELFQTTDGQSFTVGTAYSWNESQPGAPPVEVDATNLGVKQFRLYNRALTNSEVVQNAFSGCLLPASEVGLKAWLPLTSLPITDLTDPVVNASAENDISVGSGLGPVFPDHGLPTTYTYNSLNQVIRQNSPDGGESQFWYDRLGRLSASQNAEQKDPSNGGEANRYSYTLYDKLGRITTVGEKTGVADLATVDTKDDQALSGWLAAGSNKQVTKTLYDDPVNLTFQTMGNSRKRVVASVFLENESELEGDSTLYAYDLSGNVKTLVQHVKALLANDPDNGKKRVDYDYDLISGKVNKLTYQKGRGDQFFYQYGYDAENRLTSAQTSRDGLVWTQDATYRYYLHGPLARTELGHYKVQGVDYAYTLQGWLRGINSDTLNSAKEIGGDGEPNTLFSKVSKDVYAFTLGYYGGDYTPIGGTAAPAFGLVPYSAPSSLAATGNSLYNGNISYTTVALSKINNGATAGYTYGYDQLNRLREMRQHTVNGAWSNSNIIDAYSESIAYDANGNILQYLRKGANTAGQPLDMDSLTYKYNRDADGRLLTNRLNHVRDAVSSSNYTIDIDDQAPDNYAYDKIGNLTKDNAEHISGINWTVYGKIKNITKGGSTASQINYGYDAGGNRTLKTVGAGEALKKTFYIRDAQGNVLAVYTRKNSEAVKWEEQHLYGSSRLGMWQWDTLVPATAPLVQSDGQPIFDSLLLGSRTYELSNHLGNVLATISDKKIGVSSPQDSSLIEHYRAEVTTAQDYYPFGMLMPERSGALSASGLWQNAGNGSALPANPVYDSRTGNEPLEYKATETITFVEGFESGVNDAFEAYITTDNGGGSGGNGGSGAGLYADGGYRYGFNGKENDDEVKGVEGSQQDYGMRIYDPRLGRFLSVDPLEDEYPWNSPYSFAEGDPGNYIDLDGAEKSKSELQQIDRQNTTRLQVIKQNANLLAIATRGASDALLNANTVGFSEMFGTHLNDYNSDAEREAYLRGRISGDVIAGLQSANEIGTGGGIALASGGETMGAGAVVGGAVALHGFGVGVTAASDIGWAIKQLYQLNMQGTAGNDATNSTNQQAQSAHQKSSNASNSNTSNGNQSNIKTNQQKGTSREAAELAELKQNNPNASVLAERYLRDKNGKILKDPLTGEARRIDFAVIENGRVKQLVETTSLTANKTAQTAKEMRIRNAGGTFIRDSKTRKLYDVSTIQTTLSRRQ
ncbi:RHS repeat domain-containing protein [Flavisolibacter nicotianae]|uniref:RHS repeat domain-containing protein n=1 Tax=Flavisolibacter nicotianae TaxID=2364882 RepID=UPI000EADEE0C|nr:LamG-like jellyroll fold domain-containing protein [Flavisolibacter nicotianae]